LVELYGWRAVSLLISAVALGLVPIVALLMRDRPSDLALPPYGGSAIELKQVYTVNPAVRALQALYSALGNKDFWLLSGSFFICGASTTGLIGTHLIPACMDHGIPEVKAAGLLAMIGIFDLLGTTGSGWLTDRVDSRYLLFWYYALRGLSLMFLPYSFDYDVYGLSVFTVFYGLDWIATVPPTVRLAGQSFGKENAALMYGWIAVAHQMGSAAVAWGAGYVRSETGSYVQAFVLAGILCVIAALMVLFIGFKRPDYVEDTELEAVAE
jgi:predicted MFS family arabinose efflux permease